RRHGVLKESYGYDLADNLVEKRDGGGRPLLTFEIGPANHKSVRRLSSGENHYFDYDERGRFLRAATDDLEVLFAYDAVGHRVKDARDGRGVLHRYQGERLVETAVLGRFVTRYRREPDGTLVIRDAGGAEHRLRVLPHGLFELALSNGASEL